MKARLGSFCHVQNWAKCIICNGFGWTACQSLRFCHINWCKLL